MKKYISLLLSLVLFLGVITCADFSSFANTDSIDSITFTPKNAYCIEQNTNGDYNPENHFIYNIPKVQQGDVLTVSYTDNTEKAFTYNTQTNSFIATDESEISIDDVVFRSSQGVNGEYWCVGDDNYVTVSYAGKYDSVQVTIYESNIEKFTFVPAKDSIIVNTYGWNDIDENGQPFYYYNVRYRNGDKFIFDNGEEYVYDSENGFVNEQGNSLDERNLSIETTQYAFPWDIGIHYLTVSYNGYTVKVPIEITEGPVSSITYTPINEKVFLQNTEGNLREYDNKTFYYYDIQPEVGDVLTVNYQNGNSAEYAYYEDEENYDWYYMSEDGEIIDYGWDVDECCFDDDQYSNHFAPDKENSFKVTYMGKSYVVPVTIIPTKDYSSKLSTVLSYVDKTINLECKESEYESATEEIISIIRNNLSEQEINSSVNTLYSTEYGYIPCVICDETINGYNIVVGVSYSGVRDNIHRATVISGICKGNKFANASNKLVTLNYSNTADYTTTDLNYVKKLSITNPKYLEVELDYLNKDAWTYFHSEVSKYFTSAVSDDSIKVVAVSYAGSSESTLNLGASEDGMHIYIFKDDVFYQERVLGSIVCVPVVSVPSDIDENNIEANIIKAIKSVYPDYAASIQSVTKGATYNGTLIQNGWTVKTRPRSEYNKSVIVINTYEHGWVTKDNKKYYYGDDRKPLKGLQKIDGKYYYFDVDGAAVMNKWMTLNNKKYYFGSDGAAYTYLKKVGSKYYYFNGAGIMQKGWIKGGSWMYAGTDGALKTGWQKISGKWYLFNTSGIMLTGWQKSGGKWYYFNSSGAMVTGWQKLSGSWYYFNSSGAMSTGWQKIGGKWYYFNTSGTMRTANLKQGSKTYRFNSSGVCLNP